MNLIVLMKKITFPQKDVIQTGGMQNIILEPEPRNKKKKTKENCQSNIFTKKM